MAANYRQNDPRDDAGARAADDKLFCFGCESPAASACGQAVLRRRDSADRRAVVRARVSGGDRLQFVRPVRGGDRVVHPFAGHFSADRWP